MSLSHQDVQALLQILDDSPYDELSLSNGSFTLQLQRKTDGSGWTQQSVERREAQLETLDTLAAPQDSRPDSPQEVASSAPTEDGLLEVRAPMVGTWYRAPKPGAEPFIEVGSQVQPDTVIGIIEVMKLMSSIPAGVSGEVVEILLEDAQFVEKGQLLLRVRPAS